MIRRLLTLCFLLVSTDAWAATRWVSPSGDGGVYTLATPGGLDSANIVSVAGDIIQMMAGTYTTAISPSANGSAGNYIRYIGRSTADSVVVPGATITKRYISINSVTFNGDFTFGHETTSQFARYDSLVYSKIVGSLNILQSKECKIYRTDVTGGGGRLAIQIPYSTVWEGGAGSVVVPEGHRVSRCNIALGDGIQDGAPIVRFRYAQSDTVDSCRFNIILDDGQYGEVDPFKVHYSTSMRLFDNHWAVTNNSIHERLFRLRDSTNNFVMIRDTLDFSGNNTRFTPHSHGGDGQAAYGNRFEYLVVKNNTRGNDFAVFWQDYARADTFRNCSVISQEGEALQVRGVDTVSTALNTTLFDHNTFVGTTNGHGSEPESPPPAGNLGGAVWFNCFNRWNPSAVLKFTNNIVVVRDVPGQKPSAIGYGFTHATNQLASNNNLYYHFQSAAASAISYETGICGQGCPVLHSYPGLGSPFSQYKVGQEGYSIWGNPLLGGYSYADFDPTLDDGSPARSAGTSGTDIGRNNDLVRPYLISDFNLSDTGNNFATLTWTATGDDSLQGTAYSYDIRYSTATIDDEAEWAAATTISGEPTPMVVGTGQFKRVTGLTNGTLIYFVIRVSDEAGNQSALSANICAYPPYICAE